MRHRQLAASIVVVVGWLAAAALVAAEPAGSQAQSLDELLEQVRSGSQAQREENKRREGEFRAAQAKQKQLLVDALNAKAALEARSDELELQFQENETTIAELEETLRSRLGTFGELFGIVRQVAGDTRASVQQSLISAQLPGREDFLSALSESKELPSVKDLERLWYMLQQEMTESGKVVRFDAPVIAAGGGESERDVIRVGPFIAAADGRYLQYLTDTRRLAELARQPASRHLATLVELDGAKTGVVGVAIDPSRGSILSLLIQTPSLRERIQQGGLVGYVIIVLGAAGLLLVGQRLLYLGVVGRKIRAQVGSAQARPDNPLGRVLGAYESNKSADVETLELKLDEAILKEAPRLERGNALIKVLSVVAPLLGLLGTVTGMIETFQAITLFGTGDPKLMASGISQALVTTVLGLTMAIPLVLLHSVVSGRSKALVQILEEQSAGIVAAHAEERMGPAAEAEPDGRPRTEQPGVFSAALT